MEYLVDVINSKKTPVGIHEYVYEIKEFESIQSAVEFVNEFNKTHSTSMGIYATQPYPKRKKA